MLQKAQFTISRISQLQFFTADFFLYHNPAKMAPWDRSQCPEQLHATSNFQNGDGRDNQKLGHKRRKTSLDTPERCILSLFHPYEYLVWTYNTQKPAWGYLLAG